MDQSTLLGMPYIQPSQSQKHVTHNEALKVLDAIVQMSVADRDLNTPPSLPTNGDRYIVGAASAGEWVGKNNQIAVYTDNIWAFYPPQSGWLVWIQDESKLYVWDGASWVMAAPSNPAPLVGVNTSADATNRLAVKSDAVLFSHDDVTPGTGNSRVVLNKNVSANSASLVYQAGYSGRAEIGLAGDDDWHVKVSPDGSTWHEALVVDKDTGNVGIGTNTPSTVLHVAGPARVGAYTVAILPDATTVGSGSIIYVSDETGGATLAFSDGSDWRRATDLALIT